MRRPVFLLVCVVAGLSLIAPQMTEGQQPLPTPRGQLGGPMPLQLTPQPPAQATPVPPATAAPTPASAASPPSATLAASGEHLPTEEVVARVGPALVTVVAGLVDDSAATPEARVAETGSGFFLDEGGHIVTAAGVVGNADRFAVVLANGERRGATLVGTDDLTGLAVLRVEGAVPAVVTLGGAAPPRPGRAVLAFGSPYGTLPNSVTQGIVGGIGREIDGAPPATNLIQHDAETFPGSAGGPLVTLDGAVVGVTVVDVFAVPVAGLPDVPDIALPDLPGVDVDLPELSQPEAPPPGISFAVPASTVQRVAAALIANGRVTYPFFGAAVEPNTSLAGALLGPAATGARVVEVTPDGPADLAGIDEGDVLVAFGGEAITAERPFGSLLLARRPGETVEVRLRRNDVELTLSVTLGERPDE